MLFIIIWVPILPDFLNPPLPPMVWQFIAQNMVGIQLIVWSYGYIIIGQAIVLKGWSSHPIPYKFDTTNKIFDLIKEIQTGTNTSFWERSLLELSFDCYKSLEIPRKVVKLKTYMLILNCCINVLSHRNRFEYRTTVFIEYFWSCIHKKKRIIGSATTKNAK